VSDYETIQRRRNVIVGMFVVVAMCALGWLVFKFGDMPRWISRMGSYDVFVQFAKAPGVQTNTPVRWCGYQVGMVTAVRPPKRMLEVENDAEVDPNAEADPNTEAETDTRPKKKKAYHQVLVVLSIDDAYKDIPDDVNAVLLTKGFGSSYIDLQPKPYDVNKPNRPGLKSPKNTRPKTLQGSTGITSEFFPEELQNDVGELVAKMNTLAKNANDILGDPNNKRNVKHAVENLAAVSGEATARLQDANDTLRYINEAVKAAKPAIEAIRKLADTGTKTLDSTRPKAEKLLTNLVDASEDFGKSLSEARSILAKVNSGEGSAGRLVNDGKFYENLVENAEQLELLLKEIKAFVSWAREKGVPIKLKY